MNGPVKLRLVRLHGGKIVRRWEADIPRDDWDALAKEFVAGVRAQLRLPSDAEARAFLPDYRLEWFAVVGGWTRFKGAR